MKKWFIGIGVVGMILAAAAVLFVKPWRSDVPEGEELFVDNLGDRFASEEGLYYNDEDFLWFYDYESRQTALVCNQPNCRHEPWQEDTPKEQRCNAYLGYCESIFAYQGNLYTVGKSDMAKSRLQIMESKSDRSGQRMLAQLEGDYMGSFAVRDGRMYFTVLREETEEDNAGNPVKTGMGFSSMCSLDLGTGEVKELAKMEKHYNNQLSAVGIYDGKMYCVYSYFEEMFTGANFQEAKGTLKWYTLDIGTGKMKETLEELSDVDIIPCRIAQGKLFYEKWRDRESGASDIFCYDFVTGEKRMIIPNSTFSTYIDDKIIAENGKCVIYDMSTGALEEMRQAKNVSIVADAGKDFIAVAYENGRAVYGRMEKSEYYKGSGQFQPFEGKETERDTGDGDSVVWLVDDIQLAQRLQEPLNQLLQKKGADYTVLVQAAEAGESYHEILNGRRAAGLATDLIYLPMSQSEKEGYLAAVREGLLAPLELEEGNGSISEVLGEFALESVKVDGAVYGLRGLPEYFNSGLEFNKYYLDKYGISPDMLSGRIFENEELFQRIAETETCAPLAYWELTEEELGYEFLHPSCAVGFLDENGEEAVNVFAQEDAKEYLKALKQLRDKGLIVFLNIDGFDIVERKNGFFAIISHGTRPEIYESMETFLDKAGKPLETETVFIPGDVKWQDVSVIPRGGITGIASWSDNYREAYEFLKLLYTDSEAANLVKFGVEGKDYRLEDGRVVEILNPELYPRVNLYYTNDVLTYSMEQEPEDKQENWKQYFSEHGIHPLTGFRFDFTEVQEEIYETNKILRASLEESGSYTEEFRKLMSVDVEDIDQALAELNRKLKAAGISKIIDAANRQIQRWKDSSSRTGHDEGV